MIHSISTSFKIQILDLLFSSYFSNRLKSTHHIFRKNNRWELEQKLIFCLSTGSLERLGSKCGGKKLHEKCLEMQHSLCDALGTKRVLKP